MPFLRSRTSTVLEEEVGPCREQELKERAECTGVDRAKRAHKGLRSHCYAEGAKQRGCD